MGFPGNLIKIIESLLGQRPFIVSIDRAPMLTEVPQGLVLSPMLYNLHTSDLAIAESTQTEI